MMKLIFGLVVWFLQLAYLILFAIVGSIAKMFSGQGRHAGSPISRGKTFVRAYYFLISVEDYGESIESANMLAATICSSGSDPNFDHQVILGAKNHIEKYHNGRQMPVIEEAMAKGFVC